MLLESTGLIQTVGPSVEPLTLAEAKKHLELATEDTTHDTQIGDLIARARDQFEHDTQTALIRSTWKESWDSLLYKHRLIMRPLVSVTSLKYYDGNGTQQTVSTSLYDVDTARNEIRQKHLQSYPATDGRKYGIEVVYVAGFAESATGIPPMAKAAMLLLIGNYFGDRGDQPGTGQELRAYEALVRRMQRATYP